MRHVLPSQNKTNKAIETKKIKLHTETTPWGSIRVSGKEESVIALYIFQGTTYIPTRLVAPRVGS